MCRRLFCEDSPQLHARSWRPEDFRLCPGLLQKGNQRPMRFRIFCEAEMLSSASCSLCWER